jgi:two-component system OmpR family response regulator
VRVLIVEDDARMAEAIRRGLTSEGVVCEVAPRASEALWKARAADFDAVILDVVDPLKEGHR